MTTHHGPKYRVDIEGTLHDWDEDTITVTQLRSLGGFPEATPVQEIDLRDNTQRDLSEDEVVALKPGLGFSKRVKYARG